MHLFINLTNVEAVIYKKCDFYLVFNKKRKKYEIDFYNKTAKIPVLFFKPTSKTEFSYDSFWFHCCWHYFLAEEFFLTLFEMKK